MDYSSQNRNIMSRRNYVTSHGQENKYDQMTNFAIDLQGEVNRSVLFPKIVARIKDNELKDYINRKKQQEEHVISHLKGQVDKLKRQVFLLQDKKYINNRIRTQQQECSICLPLDSNVRYKQLYSHHIENKQLSLRNSEDPLSARVQRNTDKNLKQGSKNSEGEFDSTVIHKMSKNKRESRIKIDLSKLGSTLGTLEKGKKKYKTNPQARRRLRSCIIAVYFSIFLPSFSKKIYQNKLKRFMNLYPHQIRKYYDTKDQISRFKYEQSKMWQIMEESMNFMEEIQNNKLEDRLKDVEKLKQVKVHFKFLLSEHKNSSSELGSEKDFLKKDTMTFEKQLVSPKNVSFLMEKLVGITATMCDNFMNILQNTDFLEKYWQTISQGLLNNSFINNSRPKLLARVVDSGLIRCHPHHQTLLVASEEIQITLLTFDIFCRVYAYRWLCKMHRDKIHKKYSTENSLIGNFLLTIFYLIGQMMIDNKFKKLIKTGTNLTGKFKVVNKKIRPIIPLSVKKKVKGLDTHANRLISDAPLIDEVSQVLIDNLEPIEKIQNQLLNVGTVMYNRIKQLMKQNAKEVKALTFEEKFLIRNDKERPQNLLIYEDKKSSVHKVPYKKEDSIESRIQPFEKTKMAIRRVSKPKLT